MVEEICKIFQEIIFYCRYMEYDNASIFFSSANVKKVKWSKNVANI